FVHRLVPCLGARPARLFQLLPFVQLRRRLLELLVFEQPLHQLLARVHRLLARQDGIGGEHHFALDLYQGGGDHQELGRHLHVQLAQRGEIVQVLGGDGRNRDVVNVNIATADEVQQQVKRSLVELANLHQKGGSFAGGIGC